VRLHVRAGSSVDDNCSVYSNSVALAGTSVDPPPTSTHLWCTNRSNVSVLALCQSGQCPCHCVLDRRNGGCFGMGETDRIVGGLSQPPESLSFFFPVGKQSQSKVGIVTSPKSITVSPPYGSTTQHSSSPNQRRRNKRRRRTSERTIERRTTKRHRTTKQTSPNKRTKATTATKEQSPTNQPTNQRPTTDDQRPTTDH